MRNFRMEKLAEFKRLAAPKIMSTTEPFPAVILGETKESYLERAADSGSQKDKESLEAYFEVSSEKASNSAFEPTKPTAKPASKSKPVFHFDVIDPAHCGKTLTDTSGYTYVTAADGKSLTFSINKSAPKTLNQYYSKWKDVVKNINSLPIPAATTTATPAATTSPSPAAAATTSSGGVTAQTVVSDQVIMNVAKVLTDVYGGATYAGRTVFRNEMGMVREMINYLNGVGGQLGVSLNSAETLAQIITGPIRPGLGTFAKVSLDGVSERTMEKQYRQELNVIMTAVKGLFDRIGKKAGLQKLLSYNSNLKEAYTNSLSKSNSSTATQTANPAAPPAAPVIPPATPVAPAAEADDGQVKKSSLDKKFIKAATLRRLKIRSQMEAAIDSSAQMGRARVY